MFADLTVQIMFGAQEVGQGDHGREFLSMVYLPEASGKLAVTKPDEQEEIHTKTSRS